MGDGLLLAFARFVEAVRCAVEMQQGIAERIAEVPEARTCHRNIAHGVSGSRIGAKMWCVSLSPYTYVLESLAHAFVPNSRAAVVLGLGAGMVPRDLKDDRPHT